LAPSVNVLMEQSLHYGINSMVIKRGGLWSFGTGVL
jgi:hypothetical protein